jgi:probable phosphoglycerate mutase
MVAHGQSLLDEDWEPKLPFSRNKVVGSAAAVVEGFDCWLAALGYEREGLYYRVTKENADTVAMFSHGGSSSAIFAHLFNLTFPFICGAIHQDFTAITVITLDGGEGSLITPRVEIFNDARHIAGITTTQGYSN